MATPDTIIGIDPSIAACGVAIYQPGAPDVTAHTIRTSKRDGPDAFRITCIIARLEGLVGPRDPDADLREVVAIEVQHARGGRYGQAQAASTMRGPAAVRGAVVVWAHLRGAEVVEVQPSAANRALTGNTRASAAQMRAMALTRHGLKCTGHAADALGFALAGEAIVKMADRMEVAR